MRNLSKYFLSIFLVAILLFASVLSPPPAFADDLELSPAVSEVGDAFSDKYCATPTARACIDFKTVADVIRENNINTDLKN